VVVVVVRKMGCFGEYEILVWSRRVADGKFSARDGAFFTF